MTTATTHRRRIPAELCPEAVTAVVDTREQLPLDLSPLRAAAGTLATGDYSVQGLECVVAIERKSLPDLLGCIGQHRERFGRRYRVRHEESYHAERGRIERTPDPWLMIIPCHYGHIFPHGGDMLGERLRRAREGVYAIVQSEPTSAVCVGRG